MVLDEQAIADVIGPEIPRAKCTCIDASQLNSKNHDGDLVLNCNARGFRSNLENIREFTQGIKNPSRIKIMGITETFACGAKNKNGGSFSICDIDDHGARGQNGCFFFTEREFHFRTRKLSVFEPRTTNA